MSDKAPTKPLPSADGEREEPRHRARKAPPVKLNPAFDSWLETKLHAIFDAASTEPVPQDLVKLLDKLDQAEAKKKETDDA